MLERGYKTCSQEELIAVATLFEHHTIGVPEVKFFLAIDGKTSYGFYYLFLISTKYEVEPEPFFQILEIDQKIGWTNLAHVEQNVFYFKGIKIIEDEQVSNKFSSFCKRFQTKHFFRIGLNGASFEIQAWPTSQIGVG